MDDYTGAAESIGSNGLNQTPHAGSQPQQGTLNGRQITQNPSASESRSAATGQGLAQETDAENASRPLESRTARRAGADERTLPQPVRRTASPPMAAAGVRRSPSADALANTPQTSGPSAIESPEHDRFFSRGQVPAPNIIDPVPLVPAEFDWHSTYQGLKNRLQQARENADWCAHRAISQAIADIDNKVAEQHQSVFNVPLREDEAFDPEAAFRDLTRRRHRLWTHERKVLASAPFHAFAIGNGINATERLTHRKAHELGLRETVFAPLLEAQTASENRARAGFPDPKALSYWLWLERSDSQSEESSENVADADSAQEATRLLSDVRLQCESGSDPWTVSRTFIRERHAELGPNPVIRRLQATHDRLAHAMVDPELSPGWVAQVTADYDWPAHYSELKAQLERCIEDGDTAGADLRRTLIEELDGGIAALGEEFQPQVSAGSNHSAAVYEAFVETAKRDEQEPFPNTAEFCNLWALKTIHDETRLAFTRIADQPPQRPQSLRAVPPDAKPPEGTASPG